MNKYLWSAVELSKWNAYHANKFIKHWKYITRYVKIPNTYVLIERYCLEHDVDAIFDKIDAVNRTDKSTFDVCISDVVISLKIDKLNETFITDLIPACCQ